MVADAAARPARRARVAVQVAVGVRGVAGAARRARRAGERGARSGRSASARRSGSTTGSAFAGDGAVADQVRFAREWGALRAYAAERGVRLIGDIPIYVAPGSADHLDAPRALPGRDRRPARRRTQYTDDGQLWGNPLYDWPALQRRGYRWWIERFRRMFALVDLARIDHFRGFVAYWAVPGGRRDRARGLLEARAGPCAVRRGAPRARRPAVHRRGPRRHHAAGRRACATSSACPGWSSLQFGYDPADPRSPHRLERHAERSVAYTGTHDHDTVRGWYEAPGRRRARPRRRGHRRARRARGRRPRGR